MPVSDEKLLEAVGSVVEPESGLPLRDNAQIASAHLDSEGNALLRIRLPHPTYGSRTALETAVVQAALNLSGVRSANVEWEVEFLGRTVGEEDPVPGVKNVILVMSGKGGVGKSTVAANLSAGLRRLGARVGLLDADIYGPSVPTMFGVHEAPVSDGQKIQPVERCGIKLMSIGFLLEDPHAAIVWRGPMLHGALMQFLGDVNWGELDYLVLDLPPGTGDIALTLAQRVRSTGAVMVTTPQEVAIQDVYKAVSMCVKVGIPLLGVVENESYFECEHGTRYELFGRGGGQKVADMAKAPLLGQLPIDPRVREAGDRGAPVVHAEPDAAISKAFMALTLALVAQVEAQNAENTSVLKIDRSGGKNRRLPMAH